MLPPLPAESQVLRLTLPMYCSVECCLLPKSWFGRVPVTLRNRSHDNDSRCFTASLSVHQRQRHLFMF
ncbi:hypothetical protein E2C01_025039 [Portunus trituberculatus]|uniref:Uncharacterized protein n=1 Tax=Portunus trituberculatus TaxID=210409 RepID=A0A5B7EC55_PORTR|nr:hypothetical protein [Portunus trituberculatus]